MPGPRRRGPLLARLHWFLGLPRSYGPSGNYAHKLASKEFLSLIASELRNERSGA